MQKHNANSSLQTTSAANTVTSSNSQDGKSTQPSVKDAALLSILTESGSLNNEQVLAVKVLLATLQVFMFEVMDPNKLCLIFGQIQSLIKKLPTAEQQLAEQVFNELVLMTEDLHKRNPFYRAFWG